MGARWVIGRREFASIFTEKTILIAVIIQIFVAGFSSFLVVGLASLVDPDSLPPGAEAQIGYVGPESVVHYLANEQLLVTNFADVEEARRAFVVGAVDAVLVISNESWQGEDPVRAEIVLPEGTLRATLTIVQIKGALEAFEKDLREARADRIRQSPVYVDAEAGSSYPFVYSLLIPLLVILPVVLAGALAADSLTEEVQRGTLGTLLTTPARAAAIVDGKLFANVTLAPLLSVAWMMLLILNGITLPLAGAIWIVVLATAAALVFGVLACAVALLTRDRNKAHLVYALLLFVVLGASALLPASPMNAIARFAAGSASPEAFGAVFSTIALAAGLYGALRVYLHWRRGDPFGR